MLCREIIDSDWQFMEQKHNHQKQELVNGHNEEIRKLTDAHNDQVKKLRRKQYYITQKNKNIMKKIDDGDLSFL